MEAAAQPSPEPAAAPPSPEPAAAPPSLTIIFDRYQLGRVLGRGSFAKVYQASSVADRSAVAIKIIDKNSESLRAIPEAQVLREVHAMRRLQSHPNILKIHEVMATRSKIYLVMELAPGGELFSKLTRRGRFSESSARLLFQQLVSALTFCHENGVAHRDVKPHNILLDKDGNLKLSDFGLSSLSDQHRLCGDGLLRTFCGTPIYTAPEVVSRQSYSGPKADAWSCGVILFMLICGSLPFEDTSISSLYKKAEKRDYKFPSWVSKSARYVINHLLDPNPTSRMGLEALLETTWFKKSSSPLLKSQSDGVLYEMSALAKDYDFAGSVSRANAFDIISLAAGLDISGLFETAGVCNKVKRFTSSAPFEEIRDKVREVGGKLGYGLEKMKGGSMVLRKGGSVLTVEVWEIAQSLMLVEVKMDGVMDMEELHWLEWKAELGELVLSWHSDGSITD